MANFIATGNHGHGYTDKDGKYLKVEYTEGDKVDPSIFDKKEFDELVAKGIFVDSGVQLKKLAADKATAAKQAADAYAAAQAQIDKDFPAPEPATKATK